MKTEMIHKANCFTCNQDFCKCTFVMQSEQRPWMYITQQGYKHMGEVICPDCWSSIERLVPILHVLTVSSFEIPSVKKVYYLWEAGKTYMVDYNPDTVTVGRNDSKGKGIAISKVIKEHELDGLTQLFGMQKKPPKEE